MTLPDIPPLPARSAAYLHLCFDGQATARDLVTLLENDPELAVRYLRVAAGECFGPNWRVDVLTRAVVRTGFPFARKWAAIASISTALSEATGRPAESSPFWRRALCRAMAADALEDFCDARSPGEAAIVAFLWESGSFVLPQDAPQADVLVQSATMLRAWGLPERAAAAAELAAQGGLGRATPLLVRICRIADLFAEACFGEQPDIRGFLAEAQRLFDAPLETVEDIAIGSLDRLYNVADRLVHTQEVRRAILDLLARAAAAFRDLLPDPPGGAAPLPSFASLDMAATRETLQAVAHELRNPLMVVGGFARKLAASLDGTTREHEYAQVILEEGQRIEELFKGLEQRSGAATGAP